jgi:hypothetical protein
MTKPVPANFSVPHYTDQLQWRGYPASPGPGGPFGSWSWTTGSYGDSDDYTLRGNRLNTTISYGPPVTNQKGGNLEYYLDKQSGFWVLHMATIYYNYPDRYGPYMVTNYFTGYDAFYNGNPSATTFVHGVLYQWIYIFAKQSDTGVKAVLPNAVWDGKMHAWLVGFSIYLYDRASTDYSWIPFPAPFPMPKPEGIYNPLGL